MVIENVTDEIGLFRLSGAPLRGPFEVTLNAAPISMPNVGDMNMVGFTLGTTQLPSLRDTQP